MARTIKRHRTFLSLLAVAMLVVGAAFVVPSQAQTGGNPDPTRVVFELDGNAPDNNGTYTGDDWQNVYEDWSNTGTSQASAVSFVAEPRRSASIFTGGGSKDPEMISSWRWKDGGGLPDKDNLTDAFAARYGNLIVFGSDRYDNSGDAMQGFWFFQDLVEAQSGGTFSGNHTEGDLLILSDFSVGGTVSEIAVYEWVDSHTGNVSEHLDLIFNSSEANCLDSNGNPTTGHVCGVVNGPGMGNATGGWDFWDKSGNHNTYLDGEFFEGGIDLSYFSQFQGACFASFLSETRSSTSPTATLKDFVVDDFEACGSSVATTQTWLPNDSATVTVDAGAGNWSGTVAFNLRSGSCSGAVVYTESKPVSASSPTATTTNSTYSVSATGDYFWDVVFTSSTSGVKGSSHCESTSLTITN